ncbi:hypothetical protein [Albirhodobacter sp. R86504]|uniref:hypothetical protein n=1 Tax=Albirhodobacter sp. R86504 TaxID=3093848 RepID=UPI00366ED816
MSTTLTRAAIAGAVFVATTSFATTTASAFEFTGARVGVEYSRFSAKADDGLGGDVVVERTSLDTGAEFAITPRFSAQIDVMHHESTYDDSQALGLHGIYMMQDGAAFGAFVQREAAHGEHIDGYGVEYARTMGAVDFELFVSTFDGGVDADATAFGGSGRYDLGNKFGIVFDAARVDLGDGVKFTRLALGTDYQVSDTASVYFSGGTARVSAESASSSEGFMEIGAKFNLGNGTTFANRSLIDLFPGL